LARLGFSFPQNRYPVGNSHSFFQFMRDEGKTFSFCFEQLKKLKKPLGFSWGKDRRRFVEDKVLSLPKQEGQDRGFLSLAYGEISSIPL
jgi:hypothetical protein